MPALLDPSVHRDADAYVGHLVAMLDPDESGSSMDDDTWLIVLTSNENTSVTKTIWGNRTSEFTLSHELR